MEQKVIIGKSTTDINNLLDKGWKIVSVTAQHVASATQYSAVPVHGDFCFVLEREAR